MSSELKPVLKTEELELIFEKLEAYGCEEGDDVHKLLLKLSHSMEPLYEIPEGYSLVPVHATDQIIANLDFGGDVEVVQENREALAGEFNRYEEYIKAAIQI